MEIEIKESETNGSVPEGKPGTPTSSSTAPPPLLKQGNIGLKVPQVPQHTRLVQYSFPECDYGLTTSYVFIRNIYFFGVM